MKKLLQVCALATLLPSLLFAFGDDEIDQRVSFLCQGAHRYLNLNGDGTISLVDTTDINRNPGAHWYIRRVGDSYAIQSYVNGNYLEAIRAGVQAVANQNDTSWAHHPTTHWMDIRLGGDGLSFALRNQRTGHYLEGQYNNRIAMNWVHASQDAHDWAHHGGTHFRLVRH